jgi:hypothetical protein
MCLCGWWELWSGSKGIETMTERRVRERVLGLLRGGGRRVRRSHNAVHSVRNRVRVFRNGGVRRRRRHREFMALRYRVVYVGAIAVLLRFVVMRLNVNEWKEVGRTEARGGREFGPGTQRAERGGAGFALGLVGMVGRGVFSSSPSVVGYFFSAGYLEGPWQERMERHRRLDERERMKALGQYRFTEGRKFVWLAGRVRRVSRRGAVVLTREEGGRKRTKRQRVNEQLSRDSGRAVRLVSEDRR